MDGVEHTADQGVHLDVAADGSMAYLPAGDYDAAVAGNRLDRSQRAPGVGRPRGAALCRGRDLARRLTDRARDPRAGRHRHLDRDAVAADDDAVDRRADERNAARLDAGRQVDRVPVRPCRHRHLQARRAGHRPGRPADATAEQRAPGSAFDDARRACSCSDCARRSPRSRRHRPTCRRSSAAPRRCWIRACRPMDDTSPTSRTSPGGSRFT